MAPVADPDTIKVRPDTLTKAVVGLIATIILAINGWTAAGVSDLKERMVRQEERSEQRDRETRERFDRIEKSLDRDK